MSHPNFCTSIFTVKVLATSKEEMQEVHGALTRYVQQFDGLHEPAVQLQAARKDGVLPLEAMAFARGMQLDPGVFGLDEAGDSLQLSLF